MYDRAKALDAAFRRRIKSDPRGAGLSGGLSAAQWLSLFETQLMVRHLDVMARRTKGQTFYSIGSSGHDCMAAVAMASRNTDMAFLHYRDAAFCVQRRKVLKGSTPLWDMVLSFAASAEDPVSGGRHKVLGGQDIYTPPQTSTIASHLPKAVGAAHSVHLRAQGFEKTIPNDSVILCSFGDASSNHSTAQGAINAACWAAFQASPMPIVFICEDNDIGISVRTPRGWIEANYRGRNGLHYIACDGTDMADSFNAAQSAIAYARTRKKPVFLHMKTVRLMGHAGADIEAKYKTLPEIEANEARDPLLMTALHLRDSGVMRAADILAQYDAMEARIARIAERVFSRPRLETSKEIMAPIVPPARSHAAPQTPLTDEARSALFSSDSRPIQKPLNMARQIGYTLAELMAQYPNTLVFGEDVGRKGGVYGVTAGLLDKFGPARVQDILLDEQTILGMAIGAAHNGFVPIPEIQFLAYLHNAEDQLRGEAATLSFFSNGHFTNPMVVRIAGLGYQRGFGGHFHNDNALAVLRDLPGVIVACPSHGADAAAMLRECVRLAHEERRVVVFVEPIALYMTADIQPGDGQWLSEFSHDAPAIGLGSIGQHGQGKDLAIISYANGYHLSRQAEAELENAGISARMIDLRWVNPLPIDAVIEAVKGCAHILIVDECRETGSLSEELMSKLSEANVAGTLARLCGKDSFIPLGNAAYAVMPSKDDIIDAAIRQVKGAS